MDMRKGGMVGVGIWLWAAVVAAAPSGTYAVAGTVPGGKAYTGQVTVTQTGQTLAVTWGDASGPLFVGAGLVQGDLLVVAYDGLEEHRVSVAVYRIVSDDRLEGTWTIVGENRGQVAQETWTRAPVRVVPLLIPPRG